MSTELTTPTVNDLPAPKPLRLDSYEFPPPQKLFQSGQEAHDFMRDTVEEILKELRDRGEPEIKFGVFYRQMRRLWENVYIHYAPR